MVDSPIIHGIQFPDLKDIFNPTTLLVTVPHQTTDGGQDYVNALNIGRLGKLHTRHPDNETYIVTRGTTTEDTLCSPQTVRSIQNRLDRRFPEAAGHPGQPAFINDVKAVTRAAIRLFKPAAISSHIIAKFDDNAEDTFYHWDYTTGIRLLLTYRGEGTFYLPSHNSTRSCAGRVPGEQQIPTGYISVHKGVPFRPSAPLRHAAPPVNRPEESRLLFLLDLMGGECSQRPWIRKLTGVVNTIRAF